MIILSKPYRLLIMEWLPVLIATALSTNVYANNDSLRLLADSLSITDFNRAVKICDEAIKNTHNEVEKAVFYRIKGKAIYFKGDFKTAAMLYSKAINILESKKQKKELGLTFIEQAKLYRKTRMLYAAERSYERALNIFTELHDTANIATVLNENGVIYEYQKNYEKAIQYYTRSLQLNKIINDTIGMAYAYNFISGAYLLQNKILAAEENALSSLNLFEAKKDSFATSLVYTDLAKIYISANDPVRAKNTIATSNMFAEKAGYLDLISANQLLLSEIYKKENRFDSALKAHELYSKIKDSLFNSRMQKTLQELNTKYEVAEKDREIIEKTTSIKTKNLQLAMGFGGVLLLSLLFLTSYRSSKFKHKSELQQTIIQQQDLSARAIIEAEENERKRMSSTLHDGLGQLLSAAKMNMQASEEKFSSNEKDRESFAKIVSLLDDSIKEMRDVTHQMMPGAFIRFGLSGALKSLIEKIDSDSLEINLNIEGLHKDPDHNVQIMLYRIFQECINNVIKHAKATKLYISLIQTDDIIDVTIEDNGVGFDVNEISDGIGLENIRTRVNFLKGIIDISSDKGKGTLVAFHIPTKPTDAKN